MSSHCFWSYAWFDPKRHGDVSHSKTFAKSRNEFLAFLFAFIRMFRGLKFGLLSARRLILHPILTNRVSATAWFCALPLQVGKLLMKIIG
jgi:hypothetical protein